MNIEKSIQEFYDLNPFPGPYDLLSLKKSTNNKYIRLINNYIDHNQKILDIGCGTGFITNALAMNYRSKFTGIDFSIGADIANNIASDYAIDNVKFIKKHFFKFNPQTTYDVIIAQSFLTHVPEWQLAIEKIKSLSAPNGVIIVSIYNKVGKIAQKLLRTNYHNQRLQLDQESNPYETSFTSSEFLKYWAGYELLSVYPSVYNKCVNLANLFNISNGGLTMYFFRNTNGIS
jgi:2-polyprenyl-3-methyl-5-hydroxy-6-metoxy-1,4-benzoquinol methylase